MGAAGRFWRPSSAMLGPKAVPGPRAKVVPTRVTGKIADWKGKFGWIIPDKPVPHPDAAKHSGKVYLRQQDVEAELSGIGAAVSFFVYSDGTGLGAMNCRPAGGLDLKSPIEKVAQEAAPKAAAKAPTPKVSAFALFSGGAAKGGPAAGAAAGAAVQSPAGSAMQAQWLAAGWPGVKGAGSAAMAQGKSASDRTPLGSGQQVSGQVKDWKGTYGWIVPSERIAHPLFRGQIYLHAKDLVDGSKGLKAGDPVLFTLYTDSQGLGAESCLKDLTRDEAPDAEAEAAWPEDPSWPSETFANPSAAAAGLGMQAARAAAQAAMQGWGGAAPQAAKQGWGAAPPVRNGGPRTRLTSAEATGEVLDWEESHGWLSCHEVFEHKAAEMQDGKVYVSKVDVVGRQNLQVGDLVQFHVSADSKGLIAEGVKIF